MFNWLKKRKQKKLTSTVSELSAYRQKELKILADTPFYPALDYDQAIPTALSFHAGKAYESSSKPSYDAYDSGSYGGFDNSSSDCGSSDSGSSSSGCD